MNSSNQKYVPFVYLAAILFFLAIVYFACMPRIEEYSSAKSNMDNTKLQKENLQKQYSEIESKQALAEMKMKNIKTIVETNVSSADENLAMFGNMFEQILTKVQSNGIHIRAIEYNLSPAADPIYKENSEGYNVCELKLNLVGTYNQIKTFITDLNNLENLLYISKMDVTAFSGNTDYLLANISVNLYSKKAGTFSTRGAAPPPAPFPQKPGVKL